MTLGVYQMTLGVRQMALRDTALLAAVAGGVIGQVVHDLLERLVTVQLVFQHLVVQQVVLDLEEKKELFICQKVIRTGTWR